MIRPKEPPTVISKRRYDRLHRWHDYFVFWPRELVDGRTAWLETVECRAHVRNNIMRDAEYHNSFFFEFREKVSRRRGWSGLTAFTTNAVIGLVVPLVVIAEIALAYWSIKW